MKKTLFLLFLMFSSFGLTPAMAYEIAVVQSSSAGPYEASYQGLLQATLQSASAWGQKSISPDTATRIVLSDMAPSFDLMNRLQGLHPDVIIAIGRPALLRVMGFPDVPIIHVLAPYPPEEARQNPLISGIDLDMPPASQLAAFLNVFPAIKKIGTIYNPAETGKMVQQAKAFAALNGITIVSVKAASDKEAIQQMASLGNDVDAYWMLPDRSLLTPVFVESLLRFSFANRVPLLTFADKYLEMGATLSLMADPHVMGEMAGHRAVEKLRSATRETMSHGQYAEMATIRLNEKIAQKMGITANMAALQVPWAEKAQ